LIFGGYVRIFEAVGWQQDQIFTNLSICQITI